MRLLMIATGPFAVPTFHALYGTRHDIAALVTAPLRTHRGKPVAPISSIRELARRNGTPIVDPEDINVSECQLRLATLGADLLVVCDYGQILATATLAVARRGGVNLHASLLPKYRGAAPINWAIYHGEQETGVSVIHMTAQIDAGPCIAQLPVSIGPDETAAELELRLAELGARLTCDAIDQIADGNERPLPQDATQASPAPRLKKTDGLIDWTRPASAIKNHIRAMEPWPKTYTFWHAPDGPPMRLILGPVSVVEPSASDSPAAPGVVLCAAGNRLEIAAGEGIVVSSSVQPAGKRSMSIDEFLRGHHILPGQRFGPEA